MNPRTRNTIHSLHAIQDFLTRHDVGLHPSPLVPPDRTIGAGVLAGLVIDRRVAARWAITSRFEDLAGAFHQQWSRLRANVMPPVAQVARAWVIGLRELSGLRLSNRPGANGVPVPPAGSCSAFLTRPDAPCTRASLDPARGSELARLARSLIELVKRRAFGTRWRHADSVRIVEVGRVEVGR